MGCNNTCLTCGAHSENDCISCKENASLTVVNTNVNPNTGTCACNDGYYL